MSEAVIALVCMLLKHETRPILHGTMQGITATRLVVERPPLDLVYGSYRTMIGGKGHMFHQLLSPSLVVRVVTGFVHASTDILQLLTSQSPCKWVDGLRSAFRKVAAQHTMQCLLSCSSLSRDLTVAHQPLFCIDDASSNDHSQYMHSVQYIRRSYSCSRLFAGTSDVLTTIMSRDHQRGKKVVQHGKYIYTYIYT